jgi:hypothetical protein
MEGNIDATIWPGDTIAVITWLDDRAIIWMIIFFLSQSVIHSAGQVESKSGPVEFRILILPS